MCVKFCVYSLCASFYDATSAASATSNLLFKLKEGYIIENLCGFSCNRQGGCILSARVSPGRCSKAFFYCELVHRTFSRNEIFVRYFCVDS